MATLPALAIFSCQACGTQLKTDERMGAHLFPWKRRLAIEPNGSCSACHGDFWMLTVVYSQESTDIVPTIAGLGLEAATGFGFTQSTTASNHVSYPDIPAAVVAKLNEDPRSRMRRIAELASSMERQRVIDEGGKECATCGMLYAPVTGKPWTLEGYCSKSCFVQNESDSSGDKSLASPAADSSFRPTIQVRCKAGHQFDVLASFRGTLRPCPHCGTRTRVPDGNS